MKSLTEVLLAGATGYLLKDSADVDLMQGVAAVAAAKSFFSPGIARVTLDDCVPADRGITDRYKSLSDREREIFQLIAEAKTNSEIAGLSSVSPSTVETHRAHVMEQFGLHRAVEIVLCADTDTSVRGRRAYWKVFSQTPIDRPGNIVPVMHACGPCEQSSTARASSTCGRPATTSRI
jgi:DNA-binding NarL/FixJ family response regulator